MKPNTIYTYYVVKSHGRIFKFFAGEDEDHVSVEYQANRSDNERSVDQEIKVYVFRPSDEGLLLLTEWHPLFLKNGCMIRTWDERKPNLFKSWQVRTYTSPLTVNSISITYSKI